LFKLWITLGLTGTRALFPHILVQPGVERSRYAAEKKSKIVYTPFICPIPSIYKKGIYIMKPAVDSQMLFA